MGAAFIAALSFRHDHLTVPWRIAAVHGLLLSGPSKMRELVGSEFAVGWILHTFLYNLHI
jgi:hypothetical protein